MMIRRWGGGPKHPQERKADASQWRESIFLLIVATLFICKTYLGLTEDGIQDTATIAYMHKRERMVNFGPLTNQQRVSLYYCDLVGYTMGHFASRFTSSFGKWVGSVSTLEWESSSNLQCSHLMELSEEILGLASRVVLPTAIQCVCTPRNKVVGLHISTWKS